MDEKRCTCSDSTHSVTFRVARLQNEVGPKKNISRHELSYENSSDNFPEIVEPLFCGSKKQGAEKNLPPPPRQQEKKIFRGKRWLHPPLR